MSGGLYYPVQNSIVLIGSRDGTTITTEELESTYHADTQATFNVGGQSRVEFHIRYTMGAAETSNSVEMKVESSPIGDETNWFQLPNDSTSDETSTITKREFTHVGVNADDSDFVIGLDIAYKHLRVSFKETGAASNKGSVFCEALISGR